MKYFIKRFIVSLPYRFTARQRKLPDFLIIGAMKGGTSSLYHWIDQHPDAHLSREQEVHFFATSYRKGLKYYRSYFPKASEDKLTGESSPYYFYHPLVPARVKKDLPNCKIIVLLRDPVFRAYSHYQMHQGIDMASDFDEAIALEEKRVAKPHADFVAGKDYRSTDHQAYSYFGRGMYFEQLERWLQYFPKEQLLVLKSENLFVNPSKVVTDVYNFLGLKPYQSQDLKAVNQREYTPISKEKYALYKKRFVADEQQLSELLGSEFTWKYPET
ncbi:MAG: sulfotransferase domain-containing protein [bacterium]|nr:sulfotransferase domain-containing protein [bacterium]